MMNKKSAENFAILLGHLNHIPNFHDALLFNEELVEMTGFQIKSWLNRVGRLVFAVPEVHVDSFSSGYFSEYGLKIAIKSKCNVNARKECPTTGSDSLDDVCPSTIARLLRLSEEEADDDDNTIALFILQISDALDSWKEQCKNMLKNAESLKDVADKIYDDIL